MVETSEAQEDGDQNYSLAEQYVLDAAFSSTLCTSIITALYLP